MLPGMSYSQFNRFQIWSRWCFKDCYNFRQCQAGGSGVIMVTIMVMMVVVGDYDGGKM